MEKPQFKVGDRIISETSAFGNRSFTVIDFALFEKLSDREWKAPEEHYKNCIFLFDENGVTAINTKAFNYKFRKLTKLEKALR